MLVGDVTKEPPRGGSWKKRLLDQGTTPNMLALLERCLEDDPADRPADAQVLAEELMAVIKEATPAPAPAVLTATSRTAKTPVAVPPPPPAVEQWHYTHKGKQEGPISFDELLARVQAGKIESTDMIWTARIGNWVQAGSIPGLCPGQPPPLAKAKRLVRMPAIALLAVGIFGLILGPALTLLSFAKAGSSISPIFILIFILVAVAGVALLAGLRMRKLRSYGLCMVVSIAIMPASLFLPAGIVALAAEWAGQPMWFILPSLCLLVGIPIGIWSLMTLRKPGMRSAFRLNEELPPQEESIADLDRM
jgi:hypothetical protein